MTSKRIGAVASTAVLAVVLGFGSGAGADAPPGYTEARLTTPKASVAYPEAWVVMVGPEKQVRAGRARVAKDYPGQLAAFDATRKKQRRDKKVVFFAVSPEDQRYLRITRYRPSKAKSLALGHLPAKDLRKLRAAGWEKATVDGRPGFRVSQALPAGDGPATYGSAVMTRDHRHLLEVLVFNEGTTPDATAPTILDSFDLRR